MSELRPSPELLPADNAVECPEGQEIGLAKAEPEPQVPQLQKLPFGERPFSLRELQSAELQPPTELIESLLLEGETAALVARPKTGKTRLAQQLAVAVASGTPFLGLGVPSSGLVLYVDLESQPVQVRERFSKISGALWESAQDRVRVYSVPSLADSRIGLFGPGLDKLKGMVQETGAQLVIVDTWRLVFQGKENEAESVSRNLRAVNDLRSVNPRIAVLLLHHLRKTGSEGTFHCSLRTDPQQWLDNVSGHHALVAHTDATFGLERETSSADEFFVLSGVRRNGQAPLLVLRSDQDTLRFERMDDNELAARMVFTPAQLVLWRKLPDRFTWKQAEEAAAGKKSLLSEMRKRARAQNLLEQAEHGGGYTKRVTPAGNPNPNC